MYEIHTTQQGTQVHPGETLNLDYSLTHVLSLQHDLNLQLGLVGYEQWQLTPRHANCAWELPVLNSSTCSLLERLSRSGRLRPV